MATLETLVNMKNRELVNMFSDHKLNFVKCYKNTFTYESDSFTVTIYTNNDVCLEATQTLMSLWDEAFYTDYKDFDNENFQNEKYFHMITYYETLAQ